MTSAKAWISFQFFSFDAKGEGCWRSWVRLEGKGIIAHYPNKGKVRVEHKPNFGNDDILFVLGKARGWGDIIQTRARQKSRASLISSNACLTLVMFLPWALCSIKIDATFREQGALSFSWSSMWKQNAWSEGRGIIVHHNMPSSYTLQKISKRFWRNYQTWTHRIHLSWVPLFPVKAFLAGDGCPSPPSCSSDPFFSGKRISGRWCPNLQVVLCVG